MICRYFHSLCFVSLLLSAIVLIACGEDSETVRVTDRYTLDMLGKGVSLTEEKCDSARMGQLLYVGDSSSIYYCSGKAWKKVNGNDGKDGHDGKDGEDGVDGKKGKYGTSGTDCFAEQFADGFVLGCGATKAILHYDFEIPDTCSIKRNDDSSYVLTCGKDTTTLLQGPRGSRGAPCMQKDMGDGRVNLVCGGDSVTLFRAVCGETPFDPDGSLFCYGDTLVERCNTQVYDVKKQFCYNDSLIDFCAGLSYDFDKEWCSDGILVPKCPTELNDDQFCDERNGKVYRFTVVGWATWMAQNLDYKVPNSFCQDSLRDDSLYCVDEQVVDERYEYKLVGRYYPWSVAMARPEEECGRDHKCPGLTYPHQGICPDGWHLPSKDEWRELIEVMGKSGAAYWDESVRLTYGPATNSFGLSLIPTGIIEVKFKDDEFSRNDGYMKPLGVIVNPNSADIWSSTEASDYAAILFYLYTDENKKMEELPYDKSKFARTVRCVKD